MSQTSRDSVSDSTIDSLVYSAGFGGVALAGDCLAHAPARRRTWSPVRF